MLKKLALAAVAVGLMGGTAMAADLMQPPPPAVMMTGGWDGGYIGGTVGYYSSNFVDADVVFGGNLTVSESFLIGAEVGVGGYTSLGGGGSGLEAYISGRAGFLASDQVLIYGTGGWAVAAASSAPFVGAGIEFKAMDNVSVRGQAVVFSTGVWHVTTGAFWHF